MLHHGLHINSPPDGLYARRTPRSFPRVCGLRGKFSLLASVTVASVLCHPAEDVEMLFWKASALVSFALSIGSASAKLTWGTTKFLFTFGDSYTTTGFNISAGVDSPVPGFVGARCPTAYHPSSHAFCSAKQTSSNGPNWVQFLG